MSICTLSKSLTATGSRARSLGLSSFVSHTCLVFFFDSFHLDAPTTSPTPTTNSVNTQGKVSPPSTTVLLDCVCVCVRARRRQCVCVPAHVLCVRGLHARAIRRRGQGHVRRGRERACVASFNQIVSLIGDVDDRQRWRPVTHSCHSPSQSRV